MIGIVTELIAKPIKCAANGEKVNIDAAAILNPARAVHNVVQMVQSDNSDKTSHAWIGRRCLGDGNCIGMTLSPGVDLYHWAVAIEGYIYEIEAPRKSRWVIRRDDRVDSGYGKSFEWFRINGGSIKRSRDQLKQHADSREGQGYGHGLGLDPQHRNCQEFCIMMLAYAMDKSLDEACTMIVAHVGNVLW
mmetsp:Transcript_29372/g.84090  ORF Transcript_29372/g.84090 Transcript_29372/m.84090 type:complete len:190 (-) Transcript_29372:126-695(-)